MAKKPSRQISPTDFAEQVGALVPVLDAETSFAILLHDVQPGRVSLLEHPLLAAYYNIRNAVEQIARALFTARVTKDEYAAAIRATGLAPRIRTEMLPVAVRLGDFGISRYHWVSQSPTPWMEEIDATFKAAGYVIRTLEPRKRKPPKNGFTSWEAALMQELLRRSVANWNLIENTLLPWPGSERWYGIVASGETRSVHKAHRKLARFFDVEELLRSPR